MAESAYSPLGIAITVREPVVRGGEFLYSISDGIDSYDHEIAAYGGYRSARISLRDSLPRLEDWFQDGLGRDIQVYNPALQLIWEGFVNQVTLSAGALVAARGPLMGIANRVSVVYTPIIDETVDPPVLGTTTETTIAEDLTSQARFGIIEKVLSAGNALDEDAEYVRDTYLAENAYPVCSNEIGLGDSGGDLSVTLDCLGYFEWLKAYVYNNTATPASVQASTKIADVIDADPNGLFSSTYSSIDFNGVLVPSWEDENRPAETILAGIVALGDINDTRWLLGVYGDRKVKYNAMPTDIEYHYKLFSQGQEILTPYGGRVDPWDALPGKWCLITDFLIGRAVEAGNPRLDPRAVFIEQVAFSAPNSVRIQGSKTYNLPQLLARLGLGGIS